jgi:5'-3' exonuclease
MHVTLQSVASCWRTTGADHVIMFTEGRSWRKKFYAPYKADRAIKRANATKQEKADESAYYAGFDEMMAFLNERTNVTVLNHPELEADDLIGGWVQYHPDDEHVIVSTDSDFHQLLKETVTQYNGVAQELHTINGIFNAKGKAVIDKKTKLPKSIPNPKFILFEKCIRGDSTDHVFSAYPGVRSKGSKNKVGLLGAFADSETKGYDYNNFMLQRWTDHNGVEHRVLDDYNRNVTLIDLAAQPAEIRVIIDETIKSVSPKSKPQIGLYFLKFCGKHDLIKISEQTDYYVKWLSAEYK